MLIVHKMQKERKDQAAYASLFSLHVAYNFREAVELNKRFININA